jgi:hypothetical protein
MTFDDLVVQPALRSLPLRNFLLGVARRSSPGRVIALEYAVDSKPRWAHDTPNPFLYEVIGRERERYRAHLERFLQFADELAAIPAGPTDPPSSAPYWINGWLPALDSASLYGLLAQNNPQHYVEIGSGNSTKFARKAITDYGLSTKITSIDPCPRAEVDAICDRTIRQPAEELAPEFFDILNANDVLFIDSSHRVFMNSDATALFLDVLPRLKPGVLVQIHDVTLPYDYPAAWTERYYSEQYLLAAYLLARGQLFDIELANMFISADPELNKVLTPLWRRPQLAGAETHGCSFWIRMR